MHIERIDLNLFVIFERIYAEGSLTRASEQLNLTQPALSHALARLRTVVNDPLFVRQGGRMVPTPAAHKLIRYVKPSLTAIKQGLGEIEDFDPTSSRKRIHIGWPHRFESVMLPRLMPVIEAGAPGVELSCSLLGRYELEEKLSTGAIDLALNVLRPTGPDIRSRLILRSDLAVVARKGHPGIRKTLSMNSYMAHKHVLVTGSSNGRGFEDFELAAHGLKRDISLRCTDYHSACLVVSKTNLLLTIMSPIAELAVQGSDIELHRFPLPDKTVDLYLYWHAMSDNDPAIQWMIGLIEEQVSADASIKAVNKPKPARKPEKSSTAKSSARTGAQ
ncbi:LysR family transcriptional regulator [Noviherbaspirillum cavernae]|uniref:LysR family transcriptional regulator n=1 Tax=Noviherbaspirillum cavernae TaxID=2320862 RepID=A0A418WVL4_9BURK|nr:LysR family transcriptional regulator [Noviherbaspirillum cavernae]RJF96726.1 LysR family transcriptional regulator [Noviherbaspirillum cavernae]